VLTDKMIERGAAEIWRICHPLGKEPKPWKDVHPFTQGTLRQEVRLIWKAMMESEEK
jgi:hypothetical protein